MITLPQISSKVARKTVNNNNNNNNNNDNDFSVISTAFPTSAKMFFEAKANLTKESGMAIMAASRHDNSQVRDEDIRPGITGNCWKGRSIGWNHWYYQLLDLFWNMFVRWNVHIRWTGNVIVKNHPGYGATDPGGFEGWPSESHPSPRWDFLWLNGWNLPLEQQIGKHHGFHVFFFPF